MRTSRFTESREFSVKTTKAGVDMQGRTVTQDTRAVKRQAAVQLTVWRLSSKLMLALDGFNTPGSPAGWLPASRPMSMTDPDGFDLVDRGPSHRVAQRFGFGHPDRPRRTRKVLLLILVTWVPLVLLSLVSGHAFHDHVVVGLLRDPAIHSRFLFVVPLLA